MPTAFPPALALALAPYLPTPPNPARPEAWAVWPAHPAELSTSRAPNATQSKGSVRRGARVLKRAGRAAS